MRDERKPMLVFLCEDSLEGILTAVYEAYQSRYGHDNIRLQLATQEYEMELFSTYREIAADAVSTDKVLYSILDRIGQAARESVIQAAYSAEADKAEVIYRYLIRGFAVGARITDHLSDPFVGRMFAICRGFGNEVHRFRQFLRFLVQENGLMTAVIEPKGRVLTFLVPHFADRLPGEDFIIWDKTHDQAALHRKQQGWFLMDHIGRDYPEYAAELEQAGTEEARMQGLWKIFFHAIAVEERKNGDLQRQFLPKWYRGHMTEFRE